MKVGDKVIIRCDDNSPAKQEHFKHRNGQVITVAVLRASDKYPGKHIVWGEGEDRGIYSDHIKPVYDGVKYKRYKLWKSRTN